MAQPLATLARPYAQALFNVLNQSSSTSSGASTLPAWLEELALVAENPDLQDFAKRPGVTVEQVFSLMVQILRNALPPSGINLLRLLIENHRLATLPDIAIQVKQLQNQAQHVADAVVYSAFPTDAGSLETLRPGLEKHFGQRLKLQVQVDPELIGGIRVVVGNAVLDTSVKAHLQTLSTQLAAPELRR
jgi:F-type H+-transporting ATPase subunit delta